MNNEEGHSSCRETTQAARLVIMEISREEMRVGKTGLGAAEVLQVVGCILKVELMDFAEVNARVESRMMPQVCHEPLEVWRCH